MAGLTIFLHGRMLPKSRTTFIGVASITELLRVICFYQMFAEGAVGRMTGRAADLALEDRMMRPFVNVYLNVLMTAEADPGFIGFQDPASGMNVMAGIT